MGSKYPPVTPPKLVASATDTYLTPKNKFPDPNLPGGIVPMYGQDITFATGRKAPKGQSVGTTEVVLKPLMNKLVSIFASGDKSGMASRLFTKFLAKQPAVIYFDDAALNTAAAGHENIKFFCSAALSAPNSPSKSAGKTRIHQALKIAGWDIQKMTAPTDLGVPAFNKGYKSISTGDFNNGLGVMINGLQYAYVIATNYQYDKAAGKYGITLQFRFYDIFGLDDDDLDEFGADSDWNISNSAIGITAWWQLQHQFNYAPLVTRIVFDQDFEAPAT